MKVELLDYMGDDLAVVNAARVSFDKESEWDNPDAISLGWEGILKGTDEALINYLAKHNHWSPFAHTSVKFRIKAPIFVARQLVKHQVGGVWNEVSRRYVDSDPEFFMPLEWRRKALDKKQGSSGTFPPEEGKTFSIDFLEASRACLRAYQGALELGMAPEQARMILPQSTYTEWIWTGSLIFFHRVYQLRTHETAQEETRFIAEEIGKHMKELFPVSWEALCSL